MPEFCKYVQTNTTDIGRAIREGLRPMLSFYDTQHGNLPFFGNEMAGERIGNSLNPSYSMSHMPGRWLNALLSAEETLSLTIDETCVQNLRKWAYRSVEGAGIGLPSLLDPETLAPLKRCDLHNLREAMHAFYALGRFRGDAHALELAREVVGTVERYYDFDGCRFKEELFLQERGASIEDNCPFPIAFGRLIGPLVKLARYCGCHEALRLAIRLKDTCFRFILNEKGDYDPKIFGNHTHSTTAMISSLAQLGEYLGEGEILGRVNAFMKNGIRQISLDFGWCLEGDARTDLVGEGNNTADILETCLILGNAGFPGYYAQAERILRGHLLPSQLLDNHFIPDFQDPADIKTFRLRENAVGAFGFPSPWGHEYEPGSRISFNWDITGGAVGGLCEAYRHVVTKRSNMIFVNLFFDHRDEDFEMRGLPRCGGDSPDGRISFVVRNRTSCVRVRRSDDFDLDRLCVQGCEYTLDERFIYCWAPEPSKEIVLTFPLKQTDREYQFRDHAVTLRWNGESVVGAKSPGKRLCYFPEIS